MLERRVTIINRLGLHARAAAKLVSTAGRFSADIKIRKGSQTVNAKSIMGIMMLAAGQGSEIELLAKGEDAAGALDEIQALIDDRFGEGD